MLYDKRWEAKPAVAEEPWRDVLRRAADLIEEKGLAKGRQRDALGRLCLHGAISVALTGDVHRHDYPVACEASAAVYRVLMANSASEVKGKIYPNGCAYWNNAPERTKEEVVAVLREAAEI